MNEALSVPRSILVQVSSESLLSKGLRNALLLMPQKGTELVRFELPSL